MLLRVKLTLSKLLKQKDPLIVLTFNDDVCNPENLIKLTDGAIVIYQRGRKSIWSKKILGTLSNKIRVRDYSLIQEEYLKNMKININLVTQMKLS